MCYKTDVSVASVESVLKNIKKITSSVFAKDNKMYLNRSIVVVVVLAVLLSLADSCSMPGEWVDLTHPFDDTTLGFPGHTPFELEVKNNGTTRDGYWLQIEDIKSSTHFGTHMDSPCHIKRGQWTLDMIPIDRFMAPAAVVDISRKAASKLDATLDAEDLMRWEARTGKSLNGTIILVSTGWSRKWPNKKAFFGTTSDDASKMHFPGISPAAARWLARNRTPYGVGIDTASLDVGNAKHRRAHEALFSANIYGLENVANVHKLPMYGANLFVFPMKLAGGACGSPTRILAVVP